MEVDRAIFGGRVTPAHFPAGPSGTDHGAGRHIDDMAVQRMGADILNPECLDAAREVPLRQDFGRLAPGFQKTREDGGSFELAVEMAGGLSRTLGREQHGAESHTAFRACRNAARRQADRLAVHLRVGYPGRIVVERCLAQPHTPGFRIDRQPNAMPTLWNQGLERLEVAPPAGPCQSRTYPLRARRDDDRGVRILLRKNRPRFAGTRRPHQNAPATGLLRIALGRGRNTV